MIVTLNSKLLGGNMSVFFLVLKLWLTSNFYAFQIILSECLCAWLLPFTHNIVINRL